MSGQKHLLKPRRLGVDTHQELVVYMRDDCHVCRSEGFNAHSRIQVNLSERSVLAPLNVLHGDWLGSNDKHCVGGLPGNRTTPLVVAMVAAEGLVMPKTSSRAITSPAGTADTMETLAPVALSIAYMQRVVEQEGGCIAWGGAMSLSPADDILIRIERAIDLDSEGQLVASVLSKKAAAGATHVVIDLPVGPTAKVRSETDARRLAALLCDTGEAIGSLAEISSYLRSSGRHAHTAVGDPDAAGTGAP